MIKKPSIYHHSLKTPLFSLYQDPQQNAFVEINKESRIVKHRISSDKKNRYGQILPVKGYDDNSYRRNPVVLFNHGFIDMFSTTPAKNQLEFLVANNKSLSIDGEFLVAETVFIPEGQNPVADDVFRLYEANFLHAWSKWFFPIGEPEYNSELDAVIYKNWGIHEYSPVFIPVDDEATGNETNRMHALSLVKSPQLKTAINTQGAKQGTMHLLNHDEDIETLKNSLNDLKTELDSLKNKDNSEEINKILQNAFKRYNELITPKLEAFKNKFQNAELLDPAKLNAAVQAEVEKHFVKLVRTLQGKVD